MWVVALLLLLSLAIAIVVVARKRQSLALSTMQANRAVFESRLAELEEDFNQGLLNEKDLANAKRELKKTFVTDVHDPDEQVEQKSASVVWILVVLVVSSVGIYLLNGSWQQQRSADEALANLESRFELLRTQPGQGVNREELELFALGLRQQLEARPDAGAWSMYGRMMVQLDRLDEALQSFEKARQLNPQDHSNLVMYAQALLVSGSDNDLAQAAGYIRQVLEEDTRNLEALGLLGVIAFERGDYDRAVQAFELTLRMMRSEDPRYATIEQALADSRARADGSVITLTVNVDISEQLRNELRPGSTLFVFVREPDGPRVPVAVYRQQVADFPITVTLTDENAMTPERTLSSVENWLVGARVSTSGTVNVQSGDMEARAVLVEGGSSQTVSLRITEIM
ncbi:MULTISPECIES: c-type cytochrome biogenesis protein CcmI [Gammaproteobacteria]|uniref:c-type cytochrome biogenesis protein CcmI n=1 Tax=Gammaproteobacteria TaxID=1236 RepID=UPI000DCF7115|nr:MULTISPECIES: c-type cytochrome biogenesis protein CcmI [Gammaproteobacteria]RTE86110.1 c-type cytochrome biogenesis protein CcmI [Aliidiomarina sp. B3213]TCZ91463.1 c-type cytochrome biogenesis protein CcmI [Lysobacter sp. N42]